MGVIAGQSLYGCYNRTKFNPCAAELLVSIRVL